MHTEEAIITHQPRALSGSQQDSMPARYGLGVQVLSKRVTIEFKNAFEEKRHEEPGKDRYRQLARQGIENLIVEGFEDASQRSTRPVLYFLGGGILIFFVGFAFKTPQSRPRK